jgi:Mrp family chromosome partitioning ATPase
MSKFFEALRRDLDSAPDEPVLDESIDTPVAVRPTKLVLIPAAQTIPAELVRNKQLFHLVEQVSAAASISETSRLFVAGCNPGDGASTIAVALALGLSQQLGTSTVLVDADFQHPGLQNFFPRNDPGARDARAHGALTRPSGLPRLDLVLNSLGELPAEMAEEVETVLPRYRAAIVDLGVVRLDPSLLKMVKHNDLVLLVARYGQTERHHLLSSVRAFAAVNHPASGVIFNAVRNPVPQWLRRIVGMGG